MMNAPARNFSIPIAVWALVTASLAQYPLGSSFTYQGRLDTNGQPASGPYEFQFHLFETPAGAGPIASMPLTAADVTDGLFTVWVDFGPDAGAFNGQQRWLEVAVRPESDTPPPWVTLAPRQEIKPTPYALHALNAGSFTAPLTMTQSSDEPLFKLVNNGAGAAIWAEGSAGPGLLAINNNPGGTALFAANVGTGPVATFLGGNVGIGTQTPGQKLTVNGVIETRQGGIKFPDATVQSSAAAAPLWHANGADIFYQAGNVGVGVSAPTETLHLNRPLSSLAMRLETSRYEAEPPEQATDEPGLASISGGGPLWLFTQNALGLDNERAFTSLSITNGGQANATSGFLELDNLGFNIPADATITGIRVEAQGYFTASCPDCLLWDDGSGGPEVDAEFRLISGGIVSAPHSRSFPENAETTFSTGTGSDKWGHNWTPAEVNSPSFGVRLSAQLELWTICGEWFNWYNCECTDCDGEATAFLDGVTVTVYYQPVPVAASPVNWSIGVPGNRSALVIAPNENTGVPANDDWYDGGIVIDHYAGNVGIGRVPQSTPVGSKLQVDGNIICDGLTETSSRRFKRHVQTLDGALDTLTRLRGVSYEWDEAHGGGRDIGFIAEEVGAILPEIVQYEADGVNAAGMKYDRIGALAVEAIKELHNRFEQCATRHADQQARIERLETELAAFNALLKKNLTGGR